jgi:hypothetical protein
VDVAADGAERRVSLASLQGRSGFTNRALFSFSFSFFLSLFHFSPAAPIP